MNAETLVKSVQCDAKTFRGILSEEDFAPRDLLLRAALVLGMELPETQAMLKIEKKPVLSVKDERDMYIMNGIANKASPAEIDQKLHEQGMETLWSQT